MRTNNTGGGPTSRFPRALAAAIADLGRPEMTYPRSANVREIWSNGRSQEARLRLLHRHNRRII
jgi:hypothetical protein